MIIWLNGAHGAGKTTTARLLQPLIQDSRVLDAEKVGELLVDVKPGLPATDNFQHWPVWRPLVVDTACRLLDYVGGVLIMPMTVLVEPYWREISAGFAEHSVPVKHFVLHASSEVLERRIMDDPDPAPSAFRMSQLSDYEAAYETWLRNDAHIVDTSALSPADVARSVALTVTG